MMKDLKTTGRERMIVLRPLPLAFSFYVLGLVACFYLFKVIIWIYIALVVFAFLLYLFGVLDKKLLCVALVAIILSLLGLCYKALYNSYSLAEGYYSGIGVVASIDSSGNAILENVILEGQKLKGNIAVSNLTAEIGDNMAFAGNLTNLHLYEQYDLHQIAMGTFYKMDLSFVKYNYTTSLSFRNTILMGIHDAFERCSNKTTADYLSSVMFGRSNLLDASIRKMFTATGTAHVFAVSGLHVGVLVSVLLFIFEKIKLRKRISLLVLVSILCFYAYMCSFSPSVLRASLMVVVSSILFQTKHYADKVSVISFTALTSLIIKPIWIGDISFILSYGAYFGILFLFPFFKKPFENLKRFKRITNLFALNLAVTISLIPLLLFFFERYSLSAFLASFVIIPLTSLVYVIAVFTLPLLVFKFLPIPLGWILKMLVLASGRIIGELNILTAVFNFATSEVGIVFWIFAIVILSDYIHLNWRKKGFISLSFVGAAFLLG